MVPARVMIVLFFVGAFSETHCLVMGRDEVEDGGSVFALRGGCWLMSGVESCIFEACGVGEVGDVAP